MVSSFLKPSVNFVIPNRSEREGRNLRSAATQEKADSSVHYEITTTIRLEAKSRVTGLATLSFFWKFKSLVIPNRNECEGRNLLSTWIKRAQNSAVASAPDPTECTGTNPDLSRCRQASSEHSRHRSSPARLFCRERQS
jgi:hypothetical protein